jgi:hypothetical protein
MSAETNADTQRENCQSHVVHKSPLFRIAVSIYVLVAIIRKRLRLKASLYQTLQIVSFIDQRQLWRMKLLTRAAALESNDFDVTVITKTCDQYHRGFCFLASSVTCD